MVKRLRTTSALAVVVMILVAACSSAASPTPGASAPAASAPAASAPAASAPAGSPAASPAAALPAVPTGYADLDKALTKGADGKLPFAGKRVTIQTQWIGGEGADFDAAVADFEAATGIDVVQESIASQHEVVLRSRIEGKTPPDLAMLAQPAAIVEYGKRGLTADVSKIMDPAKLNAEFPSSFGTKLFSGTNGEIYAVPFKVDVKSTIWYPIKAFKAAGYEVPKTWEEMKALEAKIVADGNGSPWCVNIKDGAATGWIATDWLEDVMLRTAGLEAYQKWTKGELKFDSPEVRAALDVLKESWFTDKYVYGGYQAITATDRLEGWDPMFAPDNNWDGFKPGCWMHRQATWLGPSFFPDKRKSTDPTYQSMYKLGEDIGIMYFPEIDAAQGKPALGAGDGLMIPTPASGDVRPEVKAVAEFLSTPAGLQRGIERGNWIAANATTPKEWYADHYKLQVASDIVSNATSFGFDASDQMPPVVNRAFWDGMDAWIDSGGADTDKLVQTIDAAWPTK